MDDKLRDLENRYLDDPTLLGDLIHVYMRSGMSELESYLRAGASLVEAFKLMYPRDARYNTVNERIVSHLLTHDATGVPLEHPRTLDEAHRELYRLLFGDPSQNPVTIDLLYVGMPDYFGGNGGCYEEGSCCLYVSYGPATTLADHIEEALSESGQTCDTLPEWVSDTHLYNAFFDTFTEIGLEAYRSGEVSEMSLNFYDDYHAIRAQAMEEYQQVISVIGEDAPGAEDATRAYSSLRDYYYSDYDITDIMQDATNAANASSVWDEFLDSLQGLEDSYDQDHSPVAIYLVKVSGNLCNNCGIMLADGSLCDDCEESSTESHRRNPAKPCIVCRATVWGKASICPVCKLIEHRDGWKDYTKVGAPPNVKRYILDLCKRASLTYIEISEILADNKIKVSRRQISNICRKAGIRQM